MGEVDRELADGTGLRRSSPRRAPAARRPAVVLGVPRWSRGARPSSPPPPVSTIATTTTARRRGRQREHGGRDATGAAAGDRRRRGPPAGRSPARSGGRRLPPGARARRSSSPPAGPGRRRRRRRCARPRRSAARGRGLDGAGEVAGRGVAVVGVLGERAADDRVELAAAARGEHAQAAAAPP